MSTEIRPLTKKGVPFYPQTHVKAIVNDNGSGVDKTPTKNSNNLVESGGVFREVNTNGSAFNISEYHAVEGVLATYTDLTNALGANGANVPSEYRAGGMSVKFVLQLYTVARTTSGTQPTGTALSTDPGIGNGNRYKAVDLTAFATLPTNNSVVYYISDGESTPTYTIYTISKNAISGCEYVHYRLMTTDWSTTGADWQGVDDNPKNGSENLVESGGVFEAIFDNTGAFDISRYNENNGVLKQYASLSYALSDVPAAYRKPGMSVKFVFISDNKYVQYFLTKDEWSANAADWQKMNLEEEVSQLNQIVTNLTSAPTTFSESASFTSEFYANEGDVVIVDITAISASYGLFTLGFSSDVYASVNSIGKIEITALHDGYLRFYRQSESGTIEGSLALKSYLSEQIDSLKEDVIELGKDVNGINDTFNWSDSFYAIYDLSGTEVVEVTRVVSLNQLLIEVVAGQSITIYGYGGGAQRLWAFADNDNNIISKSGTYIDAITNPARLIVPENATKLYVSCYYDYRNDLNVTISTESLQGQINNSDKNISNNTESIDVLRTSIINSESFERIPFVNDSFLSRINGSVTTLLGYCTTDFVPIDKNKIYAYRGSNQYDVANIAFYDDSQVFISALPTSSTSVLQSTEQIFYPKDFPNNTKYIRFGGCTDASLGFSANVVCCYPTNIDIKAQKRLITKTMHFIGDSVMIGREQVESVRSLTYFLQNKYDLKCINHGAGGAILTSSTLHYARIYNQLTSLPKDADYIIMQGGLNGISQEATQSAPWGWGEISNSFDTNFDTVLQIPCLEAMCKYVVTTFPNKKWGFIINYQIGSYDYWQQKSELIKQVLDKWGIPYLDWRHTGINLASDAIREKYGVDSYTLYPQYSNQSTYNLDDRVIYDSKIYKANTNISTPEEWNPSHWDLVSSTRYDSWHCNALAYEQLADKTYDWIRSL